MNCDINIKTENNYKSNKPFLLQQCILSADIRNVSIGSCLMVYVKLCKVFLLYKTLLKPHKTYPTWPYKLFT